MLLRNLNPRQGLCNGTRLIVTKATKLVLYCKIASGKKTRGWHHNKFVFLGNHKGQEVYIPRIELSSNDDKFPLKWR